MFPTPRPDRLSATVPAKLVIASENDAMVVISWPFEVLLLAMGLLYLRILCASILRFWLLEHTTATRSGWLGIATPDDTLRQTALETNLNSIFLNPVRKKRQVRIAISAE